MPRLGVNHKRVAVPVFHAVAESHNGSETMRDEESAKLQGSREIIRNDTRALNLKR
jgi:hypothetical protein